MHRPLRAGALTWPTAPGRSSWPSPPRRTSTELRFFDGSLTLHLSHDRPADPAHAANWLPAPAGDFRPMPRLYTPGVAVLDGRYEIPVIERVEG
ncbi:DUF1214 domain-containing protein [Streptomyces sp. bgisy029]|uniref:DUF1214 domain-containing protein n=1 Tax=Streptomyces sp. bgisy029 TaxID=3413771 RepID=UPI003D7570B6